MNQVHRFWGSGRGLAWDARECCVPGHVTLHTEGHSAHSPQRPRQGVGTSQELAPPPHHFPPRELPTFGPGPQLPCLHVRTTLLPVPAPWTVRTARTWTTVPAVGRQQDHLGPTTLSPGDIGQGQAAVCRVLGGLPASLAHCSAGCCARAKQGRGQEAAVRGSENDLICHL